MHESDNIPLFLLGGVVGAAAASVVAVCLVVGIAMCAVFSTGNAQAEGVAADSLHALVGLTSETDHEQNQEYGWRPLPPEPASQESSSRIEMSELQANEEPPSFTKSVKEHLQYPEMPSGCEIVSMATVIESMGYEIDPIDFAENYVLAIEGEESMVSEYSGTPYGSGAAFPPVMVKAGNNFLNEQKSTWQFVERKGVSLERLLMVVETGRPVLVWTTMGLEEPYFDGTRIGDYDWYSNEHCVVLYGQTSNEELMVMDPLEGLVTYEREKFEGVYNSCGRLSVTITQFAYDRASTQGDNVKEESR